MQTNYYLGGAFIPPLTASNCYNFRDFLSLGSCTRHKKPLWDYHKRQDPTNCWNRQEKQSICHI